MGEWSVQNQALKEQTLIQHLSLSQLPHQTQYSRAGVSITRPALCVCAALIIIKSSQITVKIAFFL